VVSDGAGEAPIDFYFDFSSPYGYIAAASIDAPVGRNLNRYKSKWDTTHG
jgi:2-hydroxychromene-2-carboxylate isomerase